MWRIERKVLLKTKFKALKSCFEGYNVFGEEGVLGWQRSQTQKREERELQLLFFL